MVNPLLNPKYLIPFTKQYILSPGRINRLNRKQMEKYRYKAFKKMVKYAYTIPLYHDKYKKAGVHPNDMKGVEDIKKIPMISKNDLRESFPDRLLPSVSAKKKSYVICTGGTTGKSVYIYTDFYTMGISNIPFLRELKPFNLNWRKTRFVNVGNFNTSRIDLVYEEKFQNSILSLLAMKDNQLNIDVNLSIKEMIEKIDKFRPGVMLSYPAIYQHLAFLKRKGYGQNIRPTVLFAAGALLDNYTRKYVQDAFNCPLLNTYQSVEAQGIIASECTKGTWHIHHDLYNIEAIDENGNLVSPGERGHVVITRLWGRGTPIIRYTGMDDWVRIIDYKDCECGLSTPVIKGGVEGRRRANIILPNGKIFPPGAFCFIEPVLQKYKTFKIKQYQIVQQKIDKIDILIVVDEDLRDTGVSIDTIKKDIKEMYQCKVGDDVEIEVTEVDEIKNPKDASKPPPIVVSKVSLEEGYNKLNKQT